VARTLSLATVAALVVALTFALVANRSDPPIRDAGEAPGDATIAPTPAPTPATAAPVADVTTPSTITTVDPTEPVILSTAEFDPPPGDGKENPALLARMLDRNPDTYWTSLCYDDPALGQKEGIGVVFELSADASNQRLEIQSSTRGWSASVFVAQTRPDRLKTWGPPVASKRDVSEATTSFVLGSARGTYVLLWFTRLGPSEGCRHPYAVRIGEARIVPT
jgi:hypothetical protein